MGRWKSAKENSCGLGHRMNCSRDLSDGADAVGPKFDISGVESGVGVCGTCSYVKHASPAAAFRYVFADP